MIKSKFYFHQAKNKRVINIDKIKYVHFKTSTDFAITPEEV
jgi:hypothetical protein